MHAFRAGLLTARTAWGLRKKTAAPTEQKAAFAALTEQLAATAFWRSAGVERGMSYDTFRNRVPLCSPEQLAPAIERMQRGEADVLWPGRCSFFALTAGTSSGVPRPVPVTAAMLRHFRDAGQDALLFYTARVGHAGIFRGRHLFVGASTALASLATADGQSAYAGSLGGIAALNLPSWATRHLFEPGAEIGNLTDWNERLGAIVAHAPSRDISLIASLAPWALELADKLQPQPAKGQRRSSLQQRWPNLECYVHGGIPIAPFEAALRAALGPEVRFHEVYPAAEAFIAAQDGPASAGLRLITRRGVFFEFLPVAELDETRLGQLGAKAVPVAEVKVGVDYAVLLTTPGGLARYLLGDVVRFTSTQPPRLVYVGGVKLQLNAFGERVSEREITDALVTVCQRQDWQIVNFHVAPLPAKNHFGEPRGRHEWWIELQPGTVATPIGTPMALALDVELQRLNAGYAERRTKGAIEPPTVRLVMPGVFEHWLRFHDKWGGASKTPRCRSDRLIADELAQITNFARD